MVVELIWVFLFAFVFFIGFAFFIIAGADAKPKMFELILAVLIAYGAFKLGLSESMAYLGVGITLSMAFFMNK